MLNSVVSKVSAHLSLGFVTCGVVPAFLFVAMYLLHYHLQNVPLVKYFTHLPGLGLVVIGFAFGFLSLVFFVYRERFLVFMITLPLPLLGRWFAKRQRTRYKKLLEARRQIESELIALSLFTKDNGLDQCPRATFEVPELLDSPDIWPGIWKYAQSRIAGDKNLKESRTYRKMLNCLDDDAVLRRSITAYCAHWSSKLESAMQADSENGNETARYAVEAEWNQSADAQNWRQLVRERSTKLVQLQQVAAGRQVSSNIEAMNDFPADQWIRPTRVGNILTSLDDYALERYGIDTATLWSRMSFLLSDAERLQTQEAKLQLDGFTATLFMITCLVTSIVLDVTYFFPDRSVAMAILVVAIAAAIFFSVQKLCEAHALKLRDHICALIDIHALDMLHQLGYDTKSPNDEVAVFMELREFVQNNAKRKTNRSFPSQQK